MKQYRLKNPDLIKERKRKYYLEHRQQEINRTKKWQQDFPEKVNQKNRRWVLKNIERVRSRCREFRRNWRKNNPEKAREEKKRRLQNLEYRLKENFSKVIRNSLKTGKNGRHWESLVGYSLCDLMNHLESQFAEGMTWDNYGKWHIDHVRPVSSFNFNSYKDEEFRQCWSLGNLQPLWAKDNIRKGKRLDWAEIENAPR